MKSKRHSRFVANEDLPISQSKSPRARSQDKKEKSPEKKESVSQYKLLPCTVHPNQLLTHYSTLMREFVCTKCLEEVINETSISKEDSL